MASENDLTQLINQAGAGDRTAMKTLLDQVYHDLRRMAERKLRGERLEHTLQPTALAHEAYLKLLEQTEVTWENREQFFLTLATFMRRILVDHARRRNRVKRGGKWRRVALDEEIISTHEEESPLDLIALDEALRKLEAFDAQMKRVIELRFFAGLKIEETAEILGVSPATVRRKWTMGKSWLTRELGQGESDGADALE